MIEKPRRLDVLRMAPAALSLLLRLRHRYSRASIHELVRLATPDHLRLLHHLRRAEAAAWAARALACRLARLFPQPCLYSSLAGYYFLRSAGRPAELRCGLRRAGETLEYHAWLMLEGQPCFDDAEADGFVETISFPGA